MQYTDPFTRLRAARVEDPYDPEFTVEDWDRPDREPMLGFFDTLSSNEANEADDPVRLQASGTKTLYTDPEMDIRRGDRIERDTELVYSVKGFVDAPKNPFTGWQPYLVVKLEEVHG